MTVEKDTVYRGLLRPAKLFGLPLTSAVILLVTVLLGFMWAESFWALASIIVFYPALYGLAKWDPNFFDVITIRSQHQHAALKTLMGSQHMYHAEVKRQVVECQEGPGWYLSPVPKHSCVQLPPSNTEKSLPEVGFPAAVKEFI